MGNIKILKASAGSGKTYRLSYEYVKNVIENPDLYRNILAVTFTNKATEEMKRRIMREINDLANGRNKNGATSAFLEDLCKETGMSAAMIQERAVIVRTRILHDYSRFTILTIDKFFQRIIRAFIRELGIDADYSLELQTDTILEQAADRLIEKTLTDDVLKKWIADFVDNRIEEGKGWDIKRELSRLGAEIFTDRYKAVRESIRPKEELLEILKEIDERLSKHTNYVKSKAQEAIRIIESHGLTPDDFAGKKMGFINYFYDVAGGNITKVYGKRVIDALESDGKWYAKTSETKEKVIAVIPALRPLLAELCELYDQNHIFVNTALLVKENFMTYALLADLADAIRDICDENNIMPISETNHIINTLVSGNDTPFIFEKVGNNFTHYMIDEFQDTSFFQWSNFYPLVLNALSQNEESPVLIVGDVKQSIYRWRGGDWKLLESGIEEIIPQVDKELLAKNYRSKGTVINFNNNLISLAAGHLNGQLNSTVSDAAERKLISTGVRNDLTSLLEKAYTDAGQQIAKENSRDEGYVRIVALDKDKESEENPEAAYLTSLIDEIQGRGYRAKDIAVIVRYNDEASQIADILLRHKTSNPDSGHSYEVITQEALTISNSPAIRFITACMKMAVDANDSISRAIYNKYLGRKAYEELRQDEKSFMETVRMSSLDEAFETIVLKYSMDKKPENTAYLQAFHDQIISFTGKKISDIALFLKWWDETGSGESVSMPEGQNAITVISIHKAKGLQYPVVIIPYASWNMNPTTRTILWAKTDAEPFAGLGSIPVRFKKALADSHYAEDYYRELVYSHIDNLNLLYVAVTRAEEELYIMTENREKSTESKISKLITSAVSNNDTTVKLGTLDGNAKNNAGFTTYEFGKQQTAATQVYPSSNNEIIPSGYHTFAFSGKLRLKKDSERFPTDNFEEISPRSRGRIMHKVFESLRSWEDMGQALKTLEMNGSLSVEDVQKAREMINEAQKDPLIQSWFDGSWDVVRNESSIIIPDETLAVRRPDRVMEKDGRLVVVDYKFGQKEDNRYRRQVENYMSLAREMGYADVSGYIWYVEAGIIDKVSM